MSEQIAKALRKKIEESGLSHTALAEKTGVPQPSIWHFMNGKDLRLSSAQKLADFFKMKLE